MINKIKSFFGIKNKSTSHYPCYYILTTKRNKYAFFMHSDLTKFEKQINNKALTRANIVSIKQSKKMFYRFLKNNNAYKLYFDYLVKTNPRSIFTLKPRILPSIDEIIQYEFIMPFHRIYKRLIDEEDLKNYFMKLEEKWINILKSIKYIP